MPLSRFGDNQVLRLPDHGHHAAQRRPHARMHHQAAQKRAELFQHIAVVRLNVAVVLQVIARRDEATRW